MADHRAGLCERLECLRQSAANSKTPLQIRLEAERRRDADMKAAHTHRMAGYTPKDAA